MSQDTPGMSETTEQVLREEIEGFESMSDEEIEAWLAAAPAPFESDGEDTDTAPGAEADGGTVYDPTKE